MLSLCKLCSNKKGGEGYEVAWNQTKITQSNYFASFVPDKKKNQNNSKALQVV